MAIRERVAPPEIDHDAPYTVKLLAGQRVRLMLVKQRTGVPVAEQVRRAVEAWLKVQEGKR
jgi:hypothetical protein